MAWKHSFVTRFAPLVANTVLTPILLVAGCHRDPSLHQEHPKPQPRLQREALTPKHPLRRPRTVRRLRFRHVSLVHPFVLKRTLCAFFVFLHLVVAISHSSACRGRCCRCQYKGAEPSGAEPGARAATLAKLRLLGSGKKVGSLCRRRCCAGPDRRSGGASLSPTSRFNAPHGRRRRVRFLLPGVCSSLPPRRAWGAGESARGAKDQGLVSRSE